MVREEKRRRLRCRASYSITLSAMASSPDGTSMPSVRAVSKLMTSSNLVVR
jgi:hypothetical protein